MSSELLKVQHIQKRFGQVEAIRDVSLSVQRGSLHCIIGPNGAGKTTLFNILTKDFAPTSGTIWFDSREITRLRADQVCRCGISRSYQITSIFRDMTVYENVWVAAYSARGIKFNFWGKPRHYANVDRIVRNTVEWVGLSDVIDKQAKTLSYGGQRLLELAVTLATGPKLLLLDEPMAGLSGEESARIGDFLRGLVPDYTVVMIDHKMDVVMKVADAITVVNYGEVLAEGTPSAISADASVREAYMGV